jgi:hypothetical protein
MALLFVPPIYQKQLASEPQRLKYVGAVVIVCLAASLATLWLSTTFASATERSEIVRAMKALPLCLLIVLGFAALVHRAFRRADEKNLEFYRRLEVTNNEHSCDKIEKEIGL